ncbi:pilus assembly protein PilS [Neisseria meningitidis]|nr:pilus assembly protein PilS [Neisseria meningitidis]
MFLGRIYGLILFSPSFPRRRESRSVGTETYRVNGFLRFRVLDSHFRGNDGILGF